jgi:hypothetical protein
MAISFWRLPMQLIYNGDLTLEPAIDEVSSAKGSGRRMRLDARETRGN